MRNITVYYDENCGFCRFCREWIERQPKYLHVRMTPRASAGEMPACDVDELVVMDDAGGLYRGEKAYIMVLYALTEWRALSLRLASPRWRGLARRVFRMVAANRYRLSWLMSHDERLAAVRRNAAATPDASGTAGRLLGAKRRAAARSEEN